MGGGEYRKEVGKRAGCDWEKHRGGTEFSNIVPYMEITGKQSSVGIGKWFSKTKLAWGAAERSSLQAGGAPGKFTTEKFTF